MECSKNGDNFKNDLFQFVFTVLIVLARHVGVLSYFKFYYSAVIQPVEVEEVQ